MHEIVLNGYTAQHSSNRYLSLGTAESYGIEKIHITAGPGWEGMVIKAVFHPPSGEAVTALIGEDGIIAVPPEATSVPAGEYNPGVIVLSGVADGVQRISANLAYTVIGHAPVEGKESEPTPSQWEQLAAQYQSKLDKQQGVENAGKSLAVGENGEVVLSEGVKPEQIAAAVDAYLDENPIEAGATPEEAAQIRQNKTDIETLQKDKLSTSELDSAIDSALAQAKASGEFDGKDGDPFTYEDFTEEQLNDLKGKDGDDYVLTEADKQEIAQEAAGLVDIPDKLPNPNALTFSGAVSGTYDGSAPMTVEIPQGGSGGIVFEDSYVSDANNWVTNGYTKTNTTTTNLPSVITGSSKWGVLFYIAENGTTGTQMLYPIDGTYKGTIWTRACVKQNFNEWNQLMTSDQLPTNLPNPNAITFTGSSVGTYDGSAPLTINIPAGLSDDGSLQIPVATETNLGGVRAPAKTEDMTQPVGIGGDGFLFTKASGSSDDWVTVIDETISLSEGVYSITKSLGKTDPVKEFVLRIDLPITDPQVKFYARINGVGVNHFNGLNSSTSQVQHFQMFGNMLAPYFIYYNDPIDREETSAVTANYRPAGFAEQNGLGEFALVNAGNGTFMGDYRIRLRVRY